MSVLILLAMAMTTGCSSSGKMEEGGKAVEGFQKLKGELAKGQTRVDNVIKSLDALSAGGNLDKSYKSFNSNLEELEKGAAESRKRAAAMRQNVNAYVDKWREEMGELKDPTLKSTLAERQAAVKADFENVQAAADATREAYTPFVNQCHDVQKALSISLTPATVQGVQPAIATAKTSGMELKNKLSALQAQLDKIAAGLTSTGAPAK
jgi:chromosome segregation ATPase